jgi:hypothetical protein
MPHTHFHQHVALAGKEEGSLGTFQKAMLFRKWENTGEKILFIVS